MLEFISDNWKLLALICSLFAYILKQLAATRKGIRALLRADLIRFYNK